MEQKAKCILWDIATHDFDFRRSFLTEINSKQGEYSNYKSKNLVYTTLVEQVGKIDGNRKDELLGQLNDFKGNILKKSIVEVWLPRELRNLEITNLFDVKKWGKNSLFDDSLKGIYESLYAHRNRCAHNALSYQGNVMSLKKIREIKENDNYASWFTLLVLIDMIYMELYRQFTLKSH